MFMIYVVATTFVFMLGRMPGTPDQGEFLVIESKMAPSDLATQISKAGYGAFVGWVKWANHV